MTEEEWFTCTPFYGAERMLGAVQTAHTPRKIRLLAANWIREMSTNYIGPPANDIADSVEQIADHGIEGPDSLFRSNVWLEWAIATLPAELPWEFAALLDAQRFANRAQLQIEQCRLDFVAREPHLTDYIRDIFGNPFRPMAFDPAWRTDTAVSLARGRYESRDFGAMPILADALQDAGCEDEQVLNHCRDANQIHVRGCWVCDLVLGLS